MRFFWSLVSIKLCMYKGSQCRCVWLIMRKIGYSNKGLTHCSSTRISNSNINFTARLNTAGILIQALRFLSNISKLWRWPGQWNINFIYSSPLSASTTSQIHYPFLLLLLLKALPRRKYSNLMYPPYAWHKSKTTVNNCGNENKEIH